jgi:cytochrome c-type biogenesis protein CcmF
MADVVPWAQAVLLALGVFFLFLLTFYSSPFRLASPVPFEGEGLNPLLQYPSMMIHPPMLYAGYTLFAIPFAFAIAALVAGHVGSDWIRHTRRYAPGCCSGSASCSARAGATPSWAGAATGAGTPSRTRP